jgi:hypothetical protein
MLLRIAGMCVVNYVSEWVCFQQQFADLLFCLPCTMGLQKTTKLFKKKEAV